MKREHKAIVIESKEGAVVQTMETSDEGVEPCEPDTDETNPDE